MRCSSGASLAFAAAALVTTIAAAAASTNSSVPSSSHCETVPAGQVCYAINVPSDGSDDLYLALTGPSAIGYSGLGFGAKMAGSLYFIAVPGTGNVTLSVRTAPGDVMPTTYTASSIGLEVLDGTTNNGTVWTANFMCTGCRSWSTGSLDVDGSDAAMIWAVGALSTGAVPTDAAAGIRYHGSQYGDFSMDLLAATGTAGVPGSGTAETSTGASTTAGTMAGTAATTMTTTTGRTRSSRRQGLWWSHAALMCVGWILIFGLGAVLLRFFPGHFANPVRVHYIFQATGVLLVIVGAVLGIVGSAGQHFRYAHQTVGVVVFGLMFFQAAGGTLHHVLYRKGSRGPNLLLGPIHRYTGRALIVAAMVTAGLAFRLPMVGLSRGSQVAWYVVMGALVLAYAVSNVSLELARGRNRGVKEKAGAGLSAVDSPRST